MDMAAQKLNNEWMFYAYIVDLNLNQELKEF